jgi:polyphosphate kinase
MTRWETMRQSSSMRSPAPASRVKCNTSRSPRHAARTFAGPDRSRNPAPPRRAKAEIIVKVNSLVDTDIIDALYEASRAGVKIRLNVRGVCCLKPGIKGLSKNIEVVSIVDRFLEHARVLILRTRRRSNRLFISSADWMPRNLDRRVELLVPVLETRTPQTAAFDAFVLFQRQRQFMAFDAHGRIRTDQAERKEAAVSSAGGALRTRGEREKEGRPEQPHDVRNPSTSGSRRMTETAPNARR